MTAKIKLNAASGGGSFSLQAPSSSSNDRVMTLPDTADGTILTTTNPRTGNIIQVVQATSDTKTSTTSTSYVDTPLSASITPSATSSKILIRYNITVAMGSNSNIAFFQILRGSTVIGNGNQGSSRTKCHSALRGQHSDANPHGVTSGEFLDTPSTTSATTYKIQYSVDGNTCYINRASGDSDGNFHPSPLAEIILMEVAA